MTSLQETAKNRNLPLKIIKLETIEQAQSAPTPATIFSLFYNGKFVTTDLSCCLESRFDKIISYGKSKNSTHWNKEFAKILKDILNWQEKNSSTYSLQK